MMAKIEWYEEILALEPGSKVFFPFAKRLAEDGLHDKALAVLRHGLVQHPEYLEARVFLTHLLFAVGDTQTAMTESQQVFARLAPYPAFWEALSLANEAVPGDMSLFLRFMAESLRSPGLSLATALRRGLNTPAPVAQSVEPAELPEPEPLVDSVLFAENANPTSSLAEVTKIDEVACVEPAAIEEITEIAKIADAPLADPLDPVVDELCETGEPATLDDEPQPAPICEEPQLPLLEDEQSLPLFGEDPAHPSPLATEFADVVSAAETFPENAEAMLACAASVDEALAELNENLDGALEGEEPPLLSADDLDELDKTLFSEAPEAAPVEEVSEIIEDIDQIEQSQELADLDLPVELPEDLSVQSEDLEANPFLAAAVDADDTVPAMEPAYELNELAEELAEPELSAEPAEIVEAEEADETQGIGDASQPEDAPGLYLDGGLLDLTDDADETPALIEEIDVVDEAPEALAQEENTAQTAAPSVHVDIQSQNFTHETPDLHVELQPAQDESDDLDMPDDGPVRTRSMADVLAEQGDIDGALTIYDELLHKATPDESALLSERMDALRSQKTVEKTEQKPVARADKAGLRSMLENLAGRLEKRAKA